MGFDQSRQRFCAPSLSANSAGQRHLSDADAAVAQEVAAGDIEDSGVERGSCG